MNYISINQQGGPRRPKSPITETMRRRKEERPAGRFSVSAWTISWLLSSVCDCIFLIYENYVARITWLAGYIIHQNNNIVNISETMLKFYYSKSEKPNELKINIILFWLIY